MVESSISLCMIVKDEEKHLEKCLSSVQGKVDEIIVVDTGSHDSTVEIAKYFGAKVFHYEWISDFSAARNFSISKASSEFILILDADEYLEAQTDLKGEIQPDADYFIVNIKNYSSSRVDYFHQAVRLFKNKVGLSYFGKLHEHLNINDPKMSFCSKTASFLIHHTGYLTEVIEEKDKHTRNFEIIVRDAKENPTAYNLFNLANAYYAMNDYEKAIEYYKNSFGLKNNITYIYPLLSRMIDALRSLKRYPDAIILATDAINTYPFYTDFYLLLGKVYEEFGYRKDAELMYLKCLELGEPKEVTFTMQGVGGYIPFYHLAELFLKQNRYEEAFDAAFQSFQMNKHFFSAIKTYFQIMSKTNVSKQDVLNHLSGVYPLEKIDDIKTLFTALYTTRYPLLNYYLANTNIAMDIKIRAVAHLYDNKYQESKMEWLQISELDQINALDVFLLGFILADADLLAKCKSALNIRHKEWNFVRRLINREQIINYKPTPWIEAILLTLCERLIVLNEFELFEYVSNFIFQGTFETQIKLGKLLGDFGFNDVAERTLMTLLQMDEKNPELLKLLGDLNYKLQRFDQAELFYIKYIDISRDYQGYENLYNVYEKTANNKSMKQVTGEVARLFPLCWWARLTI